MVLSLESIDRYPRKIIATNIILGFLLHKESKSVAPNPSGEAVFSGWCFASAVRAARMPVWESVWESMCSQAAGRHQCRGQRGESDFGTQGTSGPQKDGRRDHRRPSETFVLDLRWTFVQSESVEHLGRSIAQLDAKRLADTHSL